MQAILLVIGSPFIEAARFTSDTKDSQGDLRLFVNPNVTPLAPFALYAAFPRSDYYGASDAHALHWGTAPLPAWASHVHDDGLCKIV